MRIKEQGTHLTLNEHDDDDDDDDSKGSIIYSLIHRFSITDVLVMILMQTCGVVQDCTNPMHQASIVTKFCMVVPNICELSVQNLFHVTLLAPRIFWWLLDVWKIF